jgi:D-alanyl-D-alanine-carboxypeptidase/D-alanyl-D-alanine-endopeptidase
MIRPAFQTPRPFGTSGFTGSAVQEMKRMKTTLIAVAAALLCSTASLVQAQDIVGDWQGTLKVGADVELRLVLHVTKAADGLNATLDSIDQGANAIPVSAIKLESSKLTFTVDAVSGTYEGTVNAGGTSIDGTWTQGQPLPLAWTRGLPSSRPAPKPAKPSDIDGTWTGTLEAPNGSLRLAVHIVNTADGLTATMDSLDQGAKGMTVTTVTRNGSSLKLDVKVVQGVYEGTLDAALTKVDGTWQQGGGSLPLVLTRQKQ